MGQQRAPFECSLSLQAAGGGHGKELELLKGITGAFRPGILTALMGTRLAACVETLSRRLCARDCRITTLES